MNPISAILHKEWTDLRQDRMILLGTVIPTSVLTALPLLGTWVATHFSDGEAPSAVEQFPHLANAGLSRIELGQALIGQQAVILFLMLPLIIPSVIASYSIVGEKTRRTLEPMLATPVRSWELLAGKFLASLIPSLILSWIAAAVYTVGMYKMVVSAKALSFIINETWLLVVLLCGPLLALLAIALMVAVSTRVSDPRTAQQLSGFLIMPLVGLVLPAPLRPRSHAHPLALTSQTPQPESQGRRPPPCLTTTSVSPTAKQSLSAQPVMICPPRRVRYCRGDALRRPRGDGTRIAIRHPLAPDPHPLLKGEGRRPQTAGRDHPVRLNRTLEESEKSPDEPTYTITRNSFTPDTLLHRPGCTPRQHPLHFRPSTIGTQ
jgi:ABC-2 type transport system permease protein